MKKDIMMLANIYFFLDWNLLGGLSAELEAGLDGGLAGDLDLTLSEISGSDFAGTLGLIAGSACFFLEDSEDNVAWKLKVL